MGSSHCCNRPDKKEEKSLEARYLCSLNKNSNNNNKIKEKITIDLNNQQIDSSEQPTTIKIFSSQNMTNNYNMNNIPEIEEYIPDKGDIKLKFTEEEEKKIIKIQKCYIIYRLKKKFKSLIKPSLCKKTSNYINNLLSQCSKYGEIEEDPNFSVDNYKDYYEEDDPFFNNDKGKVFKNQIRIKNLENPENLEIYEGEMNYKNLKHGFGILTTPHYVMRGTWRNDEFTGWGQKSYRNGDIYEGKYINGKINGKGIFKSKDGNIYKGDFYNDIREGKGDLTTENYHYVGDFKNNKLNGNGKIEFLKNGNVYEGQFEDNVIEGKGIYKFENGDIYEGQMKKGEMHGYGKYTFNDGRIYEGEYINGIRNGMGKFVYTDNKLYEGRFLNGEPDGEGFYTKDDHISKVLFSKGEFIKFIV